MRVNRLMRLRFQGPHGHKRCCHTNALSEVTVVKRRIFPGCCKALGQIREGPLIELVGHPFSELEFEAENEAGFWIEMISSPI